MPTMSTAIQQSQNSTQPRAMAYVAAMEPTKIHESARKYHQGTGNPAPTDRKTAKHTATAGSAAEMSSVRSLRLAQRGTTAARPSPLAWWLLQRTHP